MRNMKIIQTKLWKKKTKNAVKKYTKPIATTHHEFHEL
jgi:hypothetical protein